MKIVIYHFVIYHISLKFETKGYNVLINIFSEKKQITNLFVIGKSEETRLHVL